MEHTEVLPAFREFLASAARLKLAPIANSEQLDAFRQFLAAATRLSPAFIGNGEQLDAFLKKARRVVVGPARRQWMALEPQLDVLRRWLTDCDLLETIVALEDSYTELIAWALRPATHMPSAELRQRSWLTSLDIDWRNASPVEPRTQVLTEDGIPDLVLSFGTQTVVVEVKTWSDEHQVPSGKTQTMAYPDAVRESLALSSQHQVHMVFLTPDRRAADSPEAIRSSFADFALVVAKALEKADLADRLRFLFAMLITQLATCSLPFIKEAVAWGDEPSDDLLIHRLGDILLIGKLLSGGSNVSAV